MAELHLRKAEHNLEAAHYLRRGGFSDWSASAFFYCAYHCFLAILRRCGYESRNQACTVAAVEMLAEQQSIRLDRRFIGALKEAEGNESIISLREHFQYGIETEFSEESEFRRLTRLCTELLDAARDIVHGNDSL